MYIITKEPFENGGYSVIQTWDLPVPPSGYAIVPDELDTAVFYEHNGFVVLTIEDDVVTAMEPNTEAWEAWKATLPTEEPDPEPTTEERVAALEAENAALSAQLTDTQLALCDVYEALIAVTAAGVDETF